MEKVNESLEQLTLESELQELKNSGNDCFKKGQFKASINFYKKAISVQGVGNKELALLHSNCSVAYLKLGDFPSAKKSAKTCISLFPTWWKGYYRLAMVHRANDNYEEAVKNLLLCRKYHDKPEDLADEISFCERLMGQSQNLQVYASTNPNVVRKDTSNNIPKTRKEGELEKAEHFDPTYFANVNKEVTKHIPNSAFTPEMQKFLDDFGLKYFKSGELVAEGHNYYLGRGYYQDFKTAAKWYAKAADEGNSEGMYNLAKMYMDGKGVKKDLEEGIRLMEKAASQPKVFKFLKRFIPTLGVGEAQHSLGLAYEQGTGVKRDYKKARNWYTEAVKSWSGASANNLGIMYSKGIGVPASLDSAINYWKLGAGMGNVTCMENLVQNYFQMGNLENMQRWYLYAIEHESEALEPSEKFRQHFQKNITQDFSKEEFTQALWSEIENGPLKHLIVEEIKAAHDTWNKAGQLNPLLTSSTVCHKIDASTPESYRKTIAIAHRQRFHDNLRLKSGKSDNFIINSLSVGMKAELDPKLAINLLNLKAISLEEMAAETQDHIFEGHVLKVTLMEDPMDKLGPSTGIHTVVRDDKNSYQRLSIYNHNPNKIDLQKYLGFGSKLTILNPYYRIARDGSAVIRVDNFNTVIIDLEKRNEKICRYCGNENYERAPIQCRRCERCYYCSKKCLKLDSTELNHNSVCKKRI